MSKKQLSNILEGTLTFQDAVDKLDFLGYTYENYSPCGKFPEFDFKDKDHTSVEFEKRGIAYEGLVQKGTSIIKVYIPEDKSDLFKCCKKHKKKD